MSSALPFDDSYIGQYTNARPKMDQYGYAGTLFPITEIIGATDWMTLDQMKKPYFNQGWEVGAHATTAATHSQSMNGMTSAERQAELRALKGWQVANGFQSDSFAWPNGTFDAVSVADVQQVYALGRIGGCRPPSNRSPHCRTASSPGALPSRHWTK
ncbi:polysaccharide deacetylase family protein [Pseudarthrobacter sp. R1]|uniref:polysaccharide deacetylase family protein n=1 Tax=Pseudarthrobacter sp. R1 TaxID=2944934 RepID=UPI00210DD1B5|nr:polysaccharide deacetylase family protein [Pseudarthrobacter sp. R1]MCQ6271141.1 polysaccharide deacetylase family protein [Pseudarthrobacter sp. R1]